MGSSRAMTARLPGQDRGQGQEPLLGGRQFSGVLPCCFRETHGGQSTPNRGCGRRSARQPKTDFPFRSPLEQLVTRVLEEQANVRGHRAREQPCNVLPVDPDAAGQRPEQAVQVAQQRGLSGAVRPNNGNDLTRMN